MTQEQYKNKEKTFRQEEKLGIGAFWKRFTHRKTKGEVSFDIINIIVVTLLCALMIYPFLYMVSVSLSDYDLVFRCAPASQGIHNVGVPIYISIKKCAVGLSQFFAVHHNRRSGQCAANHFVRVSAF